VIGGEEEAAQTPRVIMRPGHRRTRHRHVP
jgi:hypothetical protein